MPRGFADGASRDRIGQIADQRGVSDNVRNFYRVQFSSTAAAQGYIIDHLLVSIYLISNFIPLSFSIRKLDFLLRLSSLQPERKRKKNDIQNPIVS